MQNAIVLGAGIAGVSAALHLQHRGWSVTLVDRTGPGLATSYGNAGIIQSEAVEPHPMPRDLPSLLAIATGRTNDVHYDLLALPRLAGPLLRYWWHSAPQRHRPISAVYAGIIAKATSEHQAFMSAAGVTDLVRRDGFRVMHRSPAAMDAAFAAAERVHAEHGVAFRRLSPGQLAEAEPALAHTGVGAIHWLDPWTVRDPGALVRAYADHFVRSGGTFAHGNAESLTQLPTAGWRIKTLDGLVEAGHVIVALGPWSPDVMRKLGYRFPMVRKRGYHRHYRTQNNLNLPLMDAGFGYVLAPMSRGLRITTGAEFAARAAPSTPVQLGRAERAARQLLALGTPVEEVPWSGSRPCMPDMLPVIGPAAAHKGLWMHFGHGHQGFTLGPATGRMLAELMVGEKPFVDARPFSPQRWSC
jgi:D-lysine oxidase